jgi:hypothetical protein
MYVSGYVSIYAFSYGKGESGEDTAYQQVWLPCAVRLPLCSPPSPLTRPSAFLHMKIW